MKEDFPVIDFLFLREQTVCSDSVCLYCYFQGLCCHWGFCQLVATVIGGFSGGHDPADGSIASVWTRHASTHRHMQRQSRHCAKSGKLIHVNRPGFKRYTNRMGNQIFNN